MNRVVAILGALTLALGAGCSKKVVEKGPTPVIAQSVEPHTLEEALRYSANVEPYTSVSVAFKVSGYVDQILQVRGADGRMRDVQDGDFVSKGQVLARLRQTEFLDRISQAKAHLAEATAAREKARQDFERATALFSTQSLTKPDYDSALARDQETAAKQDGARATLRQAELDQHDSALRAPADGVLLKRAIEIGSLVGPGTQGFVLADTSSVKVIFGAPDVMVARARLGQRVPVTTEALEGADINGRVTRISPAADSQTRLFEVELTVPNPHNRLKVGMIVSLSTPLMRAAEAPLVVPLTSVIRPKNDPGAYAVYVIEEKGGDRLARLRRVQVGEVYGNLIAVTDGVRRGERVVSSGTMLLADGDRVRLVPQVVPR